MTEWRPLPLTQRSLADADLPTRGVFKLGDDLTPRVVYVVWFSEPADWQKVAANKIVYAAHVRHVLPDPQTPEEAFVTSIIMQAYRDLFVSIRNESNASFTTQSDQDQAITFLTDKAGAMARHRNSLCSLIGWDGDVLAVLLRAMMEGDNFPHPSTEPKPAAHAQHEAAVERLRRRWRDLKSPPKRPASSVGNLIAAE